MKNKEKSISWKSYKELREGVYININKGRTKCSKVSTVKAFCQGAGITLAEFFNKDYFNDYEE